VNSGDIEFTVPDLDYRTVSYDTSADLMFMALGEDNAPVTIRRSGPLTSAIHSSYSFEEYLFLNGPYESLNVTSVTMSSNTSTGGGTITASAATFDEDRDVGRLIKIVFPETIVTESFTATGNSDSIGVRGYGEDREILLTLTGGAGVIELQRYNATTSAWDTIRTYNSSDTSDIIIDKFDDELKYYRVECTTHTSGTIKAELTYVSTYASGHGKIVNYNSSTSVGCIHYTSFIYAPTPASEYWYFGAWYPGAYPQGVTVYEGRVIWASKNRIDMTVTDDYYNFDTTIPGDSAAISKTIGFGPVDNISWIESATRLFMGLPTTEVLIRSNSFDEPLTPTNTNLKPGKGAGSKQVRAVAFDENIYFVGKDGLRIHSVEYSLTSDAQRVFDQMLLHPSICEDGIAGMVVTKSPETRIFVLTDQGELRVLLKEPAEEVQGWSRMTIDGTIEDICVTPINGEDEIWAIVRRDGNSQVEKLNRINVSGDDLRPLDSFVYYNSPGTATLTGLDHLNGETVTVYADGAFLSSTYVPSSGSITIDSDAYTHVTVGLAYTAKWRSSKLGDYVPGRTIGQRVRVTGTAIVMGYYVPGSLQIGRDENNLNDLFGDLAGAYVDSYDEQPFSFNGLCDTDSRIYLEATGPCKIKALAYNVNVRVKKDGK
jgi:hypothetical protein